MTWCSSIHNGTLQTGHGMIERMAVCGGPLGVAWMADGGFWVHAMIERFVGSPLETGWMGDGGSTDLGDDRAARRLRQPGDQQQVSNHASTVRLAVHGVILKAGRTVDEGSVYECTQNTGPFQAQAGVPGSAP
ncbi:hypothetical protein HerbRD11066_22200 [Herbidospora sp. RD11066]